MAHGVLRPLRGAALPQRLAALHREIVDVVRRYQPDVAALEQSNRDKEAVVLRFETLEQARRELTNRVAARLGVPPDQARVSTFCERLGAQGASLQEAAENLRAVIGSLKELVDVGRGMLVASVGSATALELGLSPLLAESGDLQRVTFGKLEPLVSRMQETEPDRLLPLLVVDLRQGTDLKTLVAAAALANVRAFAGGVGTLPRLTFVGSHRSGVNN